jgi:hypothetical protein
MADPLLGCEFAMTADEARRALIPAEAGAEALRMLRPDELAAANIPFGEDADDGFAAAMAELARGDVGGNRNQWMEAMLARAMGAPGQGLGLGAGDEDEDEHGTDDGEGAEGGAGEGPGRASRRLELLARINAAAEAHEDLSLRLGELMSHEHSTRLSLGGGSGGATATATGGEDGGVADDAAARLAEATAERSQVLRHGMALEEAVMQELLGLDDLELPAGDAGHELREGRRTVARALQELADQVGRLNDTIRDGPTEDA